MRTKDNDFRIIQIIPADGWRYSVLVKKENLVVTRPLSCWALVERDYLNEGRERTPGRSIEGVDMSMQDWALLGFVETIGGHKTDTEEFLDYVAPEGVLPTSTPA